MKAKATRTKAKRLGKSKSKSKKVPRQRKVVKHVATSKEKKLRKKSASILAKKTRLAAVAAKRSATANSRQDQARAAQKKGKEAKEAARKRLTEAESKKRELGTAATRRSGARALLSSNILRFACGAVENPASLSTNDTGSGEVLKSDCNEDEEEMLLEDIIKSSEDSDVPSDIPEDDDSLHNKPPTVVLKPDSL
ncbi:hypothetical protein DVH05_024243 [Phytophthora capsici]|nr:hypothetical protein DVH05_024243 [Phytophthora capsici]